MRISTINGLYGAKINFKSIREDKHKALELAEGDKPISENNKLNIYAALNNLSRESDEKSIAFLLHIADNLAYGQNENSEFTDILDAENITPPNRQNTNWFQILDNTISQAILHSSGKEDLSAVIDEYKRIFTEKQPLTESQKELLDLRAALTARAALKTDTEDLSSLELLGNISKNLDYFIASSEVPLVHKKESLSLLNKFMSDEYEINPQLQNKKLQILDEILNDIVVKTPDDTKLKTKTIDQRQSGMCASISICRKLMAYEDKVKFISLIMDELSTKPTITAFDITKLGSGETIEIPKIDIDYNIATQKGYRIIDASAHNWMNNAFANGNGTLQTEKYIAFDGENYGIFDDSAWYTMGDESENSDKMRLLRALIKEKEYIDSFAKSKVTLHSHNQMYAAIKKEAFEEQKSSIGRMNSIFADIFPNKTQKENTALIKSLLKFYTDTNSNNQANIDSRQ